MPFTEVNEVSVFSMPAKWEVSIRTGTEVRFVERYVTDPPFLLPKFLRSPWPRLSALMVALHRLSSETFYLCAYRNSALNSPAFKIAFWGLYAHIW